MLKLRGYRGDILIGGWCMHVIYLMVNDYGVDFGLPVAHQVPVSFNFPSDGFTPEPPKVPDICLHLQKR